MIKKPDFIIYDRPQVEATRAAAANTKVYPMTAGLWQKEALDTLGMFGAGEGNFSAVAGEQLTLFPMDTPTVNKPLNLDDPNLPVAHAQDFRFLSQDWLRQVQAQTFNYQVAPATPAQPTHAADAVSATNGELINDKTEIKEDNFPGRVHYKDGGLYTRKAGESEAEYVKRHENAPNYRKMQNKPIHGVGQPTKQGFRDVLDRLGAKDKPIVWTNTRAEAVIYIGGKPHNLRELAAHENLVLKEGATGAEVEALEEELKKRLIAKGSFTVVEEVKGPDGKTERRTKTVDVKESPIETTKDVIEDMRAEGYKVEYKRIPLVDEKSPTPAQIDELREWMNEAQGKHPDANLEFVFNCHQGRGRTTTGMVAGAIALDGHTKQLELPFGYKIGEDSRGRADRIIDEAFHMQNLRETIDETKKKAAAKEKEAQELEARAAAESDAAKKADLESQAAQARKSKEKYDTNATDFTKRYALMQKYSDYIDKYGADCKSPTFDQWMSQSAQEKDLDAKWAALNEKLGLENPVALA